MGVGVCDGGVDGNADRRKGGITVGGRWVGGVSVVGGVGGKIGTCPVVWM